MIAADDLHHWFQRDGIHKMHADDLRGPPCQAGNACDGYSRGIDRDNAMRRADRIDPLVYGLLDLPFFGHVFNDIIYIFQQVVLSRKRDTAQYSAWAFQVRVFVKNTEESNIPPDLLVRMLQDVVCDI